MIPPVRGAFLEAADAARALVAAPATERRWREPGASAGTGIAALAGRLARHVVVVEEVSRAKPPRRAPAANAPQYLVAAPPEEPPPVTEGPGPLLARVDEALASLRGRLGALAPGHVVPAPGAVPMLLDEYLVTRIVGLVVHADDLASGLGEPAPAFGPVTTACAIGCLLEVARLRSGDLSVVRAMVRPGRDDPPAIPFRFP
ncbi:MAG: hypothetical protein KatS3mg009_1963 [Acidimicrobiia bacterium]|nr:MAG: hypothetical protein KatS3mg009_1963 [Acidimicrobiia bacterium]